MADQPDSTHSIWRVSTFRTLLELYFGYSSNGNLRPIGVRPMKGMCVVIGTGLAGTMISNALAERFDVTVLERGPSNSAVSPEVNFSNKKLAEVDTFCYGAGGTTNRWHNGLIPMRVDDVSDPTFQSVLKDAHRFIDEAASTLHFPEDSYSAAFDKLLVEAGAIGDRICAFPDGVDCLVYPKRYAPLKTKPSVRAYYDVNSIHFKAERRSITSIHFSSGGVEQTIQANILIVAAGALGTPGVLCNILTVLGEEPRKYSWCFVSHPMGFVGKFRFPVDIADAVSEFALLDKGRFVSNNIVRLKSDCGRYTAAVYFRPALTMENRLALYRYKSRLGGSRGAKRLRTALSAKVVHPDVLNEIVSHLFSLRIPTRTYSLLFLGEQRSRTHRVSHSDGCLTIDWSISESEMKMYRAQLGRFVEMISGVAETANVQTDLTHDWLWSAAHHSGTVLMGDHPEACIDRDLRLRCSDNVFVCDGSVIQEHAYTNTGLTIGQLALRLAEHVAS